GRRCASPSAASISRASTPTTSPARWRARSGAACAQPPRSPHANAVRGLSEQRTRWMARGTWCDARTQRAPVRARIGATEDAAARRVTPASRSVPLFGQSLTLEEQRDRGREAVEERAPADGADLAAAEEPGDRVRADRTRDGERIVVRLREHVRAAPVAGERERAGGAAAAEPGVEALAEILVGAGGVAAVEAKRLADAHLLADGETARRLVEPDDAADQEVAATVLRPVLVDDDPGEETLRDELPLRRGERGHVGAQPVERPLARELEDEVALGAGDDGLAAEGCAALGDDGAHGDAGDDDADRALLVHLAVDDQRLRPGRARARRDPADERQARPLVVQLAEERPGGEAEGVDDHHHERRAGGVREARHGERTVVAQPYRLGVVRIDRRARKRRGPDGHARAGLEFRRPSQDALGDAADDVLRVELAGQRFEGGVGVVRVPCADEGERQLGLAPPELTRSLPRGLRGGPSRFRRRREPGADPRRLALRRHVAWYPLRTPRR